MTYLEVPIFLVSNAATADRDTSSSPTLAARVRLFVEITAVVLPSYTLLSATNVPEMVSSLVVILAVAMAASVNARV